MLRLPSKRGSTVERRSSLGIDRRPLRGAWPKLLLVAACGLLLASCGDATDQTFPLECPCAADSQCASDFCADNPWQGSAKLCKDPEADPDGDGLRDVEERIAGTDPTVADSDGDGLSDAKEVGPNPAIPFDTDGDGASDAAEANNKDADGDCLNDQIDPDNTTAADAKALAAIACVSGVCKGKATEATCDDATKKVTCKVLTGVPFEPLGESLCDGLDNDCDGETDESLSGKAGQQCGEFGVCAGATTSRCVGGAWNCNLGKLVDYQNVEDRCDGKDNDCDGKSDETPICDDGLDCTADTCDGSASSCVHKPENKTCNDGNPCTVNLCESAGGCKTLARIGTCDDGNPCTAGENCKGGKCVGGTVTTCNDGNPCTANLCNTDSGCLAISLSDGAACKPGAKCFQTGTCKAGVCDGKTKVDCEDGNNCTKDLCKDATGACEHDNVTGLCDDGIACTVNDKCAGSLCKGTPEGTPAQPCCTKHSQCDDSNPCSEDVCKNGACQTETTTLNGDKCDDSNKCTLSEKCVSGVCAAGALEPCDDDDKCTLDSCESAAGCGHATLPDGANCDDGNVCNGTAACKAGQCTDSAALQCNDGNPCTNDSCDAKKGCQNEPHQAGCADGNQCTVGDTCQSGNCEGKVLACNDDNPCTLNTCEIAKGCVYKPISGVLSCNDGNSCTLNDACKGGKCVGAEKGCDDNKACSIDTCDKTLGCVHDVASTEATACDDGNACTLGDVCKSGNCTSGVLITCSDSNVCTDDACDKVSGVCKYTFNVNPCTPPSGCVSNATCDKGLCKGVSKVGCCTDFQQCKDDDSCTVDVCGGDGSCTYTLVSGTSCDDGNKCTTGDKCSAGSCTSGASVGCNDAKPCTIDYCLSGSGCQHLVKVTGSCPDADLCNGEEQCDKTGTCVAAAKPLSCDDANPCTLDLCKAANGCANTYEPPGEPCDDGSNCTVTDKCDGVGACKGQLLNASGCCASASDCDDGFACTTDGCDAKTSRCVQTPLICSGTSCMLGWCSGGTCTQKTACDSPVVFAEDFEAALTPGWWLTAEEATSGAGFGWVAEAHSKAAAGKQSLHCGYGNGKYSAVLPPIPLAAGAWELTFSARLSLDSDDCSKGSLSVRFGDKELHKLCKSNATMQQIKVSLPVLSAQSVALVFAFNPVSGKPDAARGAWLDDVKITAGTAPAACSCSTP